MNTRALAALLAAPIAAATLTASAADIYPQYPSLTPDGEFAVFSWAGDLWSVPADGGPATRLTSHPADEYFSAVSPDGDLLAFTSDREGAMNIYVADLSRAGSTLIAAAPRRVTFADSGQVLSGFTADGEDVLFSSYQDRDIYREERMYAAPLDGGPVRALTDAYGEHPTMSADGETVAFARGSNNKVRPIYRGPSTGEIWTLDTGDGAFTRLTNDDADDIEPSAMPDGSVVYISSADGQYNVWRKSPGANRARQLTSFKPAKNEHTIAHGVRDLGVSGDGSTAVFAVWDTLYTLDLTRNNARPRAIEMTVSGDTASLDLNRIDLDNDVSEAVLSPDGQTIAVVARGEIFVRSTADDRPTWRVTRHEARDQQVVWSPDGSTLYFVSDRDGPQSLYAATVLLSRQDIEPADENADDEADEPESEENETDENEPGEDASDESDTDEGDDDGEDGDDEDGDDDEKDEGPSAGDRWAEALRFEIEPVLVSGHTDQYPKPSPDGDEILFVRDRGDLMLYDLEDEELITLQEGWDEPDAQWAGDGVHVVFSRMDLQFNSDIFLLNVEAVEEDPDSDAAKPINITRHPDLDTSPRLSHDGKVLYFLSDRSAPENWTYDVFAVFLDDSLDDLAGYELDEYFKDAKKAAGKLEPAEPRDDDDDAEDDDDESDDSADDEAYEFDTHDAYLRVRRITSIPASEGNLAITPAGDRVLFTSSIDGDRGLYSVDHRGRERKTVHGGGAGSVSTSLTGDKAVFVSGGQARTAPPEGGKTETLAIDAPVTIDSALERKLKFREAARTFGMMFYHPTMKGLDWDALSERYEQLAMGTRTTQSMNRVLSALFGEADGSHTGARGGPGYDAPSPRVGMLGIDTVVADDGYEVTRVLRDGPADNGEQGLLPGDTITHINGDPIAEGGIVLDLRAAMLGTSGKETLVTVRRPMDGQGDDPEVHLLLIPHSQGAETNMRYRDEVEQREARVAELSGGRIGYLHIRGMGGPQVRDYERDLYAAAHGKDGLIIDVRDNGGGWTTDILLASLTAPAHAYTVPRGADPDDAEFDSYPRGRRLIHAYQRPLSVLMNQHSYSNAEIFSHAIKTTGRGKLVGTETHGAVISTGSHGLIDGSFIRIPFRGWYLPDGTDMEHHGAVPDIDVPMLPADEAAGRDPQLKAAVDDLLQRIDSGEG